MKQVQAVIDAATRSGKIVGTSVIVAQKGKVVFEQHAGFADRETKKPVTEKTLFRLASMTKPITSAATLALAEKKVIELDAPITEWLPYFTPKTSDNKTPKITVRHLLTHTAGLSYGFMSPDNEPYLSAGVSDGLDESVLSLEENLKRMAKVPLLFTPGSQWHYSLATDVLGGVLEKATGKVLKDVVSQYVTQPLGMADTMFYLTDIEHLAKAYADDVGQPRLMKLQDNIQVEGLGRIYYNPCRIANAKAYNSGGAGLVGTARDYLKFLEAIRKGGSLILTQSSVNALTTDAIYPLEPTLLGAGFGFGLGFGVVRDAELANTPRHNGSFRFGGAYGGQIFVDPVAELSVIMFCNTAVKETDLYVERLIQAIYQEIR